MSAVQSNEELQKQVAVLKKRLEQASQNKAIDQLQDLMDNTSEIIVLLSLDGRFLFINKAWKEAMGYNIEDLSRLHVRDIIHPQFIDATLDVFQKIRNGEKVGEFETVLRNREGKRVYLMGTVNCRYDQEKATAFRCMFRDITLRKRAEKSQNLYYSIAQHSLNYSDLSDFLNHVHIDLQKNIYANNFFVALYDHNKSYLFFPYYVDDYFQSNMRFTKRKLGNGLTEYAIVQNKPILLYKEDIEKLANERSIVLYGQVPAVMLCVPLKVGDKTTGIIGVKSYSDKNKFSYKDLELLEFISGQVAIVLARKQAEQDMKNQTARLNAIFDSSSHMIWTVNKKFLLSSFNKNYSNLIETKLGMPPQMNISTQKLGWKLISPEDRPILQSKYNAAFKGKLQNFEMHWGNIDGGDEWYEFYLNPILSADGGYIEEVSGIARNITEKKNALIALQQSEEKFRNIVESFLDIYYRTDLSGKITMISPSVLLHTGYSEHEIVGNKVDTFFENATDSSKSIKGLLKMGSLTNYEVKVRRKNGELRDFMLNIRLVRNHEGLPFEVEGVARDITELKKAAADLFIAKEEAEHSLLVKERFLANMSHEIRTPMNGVIGMIDLLIDTHLNQEQKDYVTTIKKSSETLLNILNDILDLSKIEAGKMELHKTSIDLKELLNSLISLFKQRAFEKNNTLCFDVAEDVPTYLIADQTRLLQIFSNLTSNALKFTENGEVKIKITKLSEFERKCMLKVEVIDSGIGISADNQKLLFGAFQQIDNSTKKSFGGTGLGLAISRELCRLMNGDMGVISEEKKGSIFWFTFEEMATDIAPENDSLLLGNKPISQFFTTIHPKVLLVDDNQINRKVASEIMIKSGCVVTQVDSGKRAIEAFGNDNTFDVILMDIQMPEMDGIETTKIMREKYGETLPKIVAMTAYSMQQDKEKFLSKGMDDYISKPIRAYILLNKIQEIVLAHRNSSNIIHVQEAVDTIDETNDNRFDFEVINSLKEMVGEEMLQTVFQQFAEEAEEQLKNTKEAFLHNDVVTIQKELHTLKGNSGTIGLMKIHEITEIIEVPSKIGDLSAFEANFELLEKEFNYFLTQIKNLA